MNNTCGTMDFSFMCKCLDSFLCVTVIRIFALHTIAYNLEVFVISQLYVVGSNALWPPKLHSRSKQQVFYAGKYLIGCNNCKAGFSAASRMVMKHTRSIIGPWKCLPLELHVPEDTFFASVFLETHALVFCLDICRWFRCHLKPSIQACEDVA